MNVSVGRDRSGRLLLRPVRGLPFLWFVPRAEARGYFLVAAPRLRHIQFQWKDRGDRAVRRRGSGWLRVRSIGSAGRYHPRLSPCKGKVQVSGASGRGPGRSGVKLGQRRDGSRLRGVALRRIVLPPLSSLSNGLIGHRFLTVAARFGGSFRLVGPPAAPDRSEEKPESSRLRVDRAARRRGSGG